MWKCLAMWRAVWVSVAVGVLGACFADQLRYDTIVVGAGAAGCSAAAELSAAGRRVLLLDAQDRIGGRVWTRPFADGVVEVGAEWIAGTVNSRVFDAAMRANVSLVVETFNFELLNSNGGRAPAQLKELIEVSYEAYSNIGAGKTSGPVGDVIVAKLHDYMEHHNITVEPSVLRQLLASLQAAILSNDAAADWNLLDAASPAQELGGEHYASWHRHGYKTFFEIVLNTYNNGPGYPTLDIKLNKEVTSITWPQTPEQPVVVHCGETSYTADNVIVTVSLGVLKERHASLFVPALPADKVAAIESIGMGSIGKIILSLERPWKKSGTWLSVLWGEAAVAALPAERRWVSALLLSVPLGACNVVTLWTNGNHTRYVETLPEEEVKQAAVEFLQQVFGNDADPPPPVTGIIRSTWSSSPLFRGTYSYDALAAVPGARDILARPLTDSSGAARVLFAGEATSALHYGYVHGAAETGRREAARLLGGNDNQHRRKRSL